MLPDFPSVKAHVESTLLRWCLAQIPQLAPLLGQIKSSHQHEGKRWHLSRSDKSTEETGFEMTHFEFVLTRDEMRRTDLPSLLEKLKDMAEQMAEAQETMLFSRVSAAAEAIGNTVDAGGDIKPEHLLEMLEKIQMDFDPATGEPAKGQVFVMHPDTAAKVVPKVKAWENDPAFRAEHDRIIARKREEWRAREDRRKLVD
jgi:hypothetical protein